MHTNTLRQLWEVVRVRFGGRFRRGNVFCPQKIAQWIRDLLFLVTVPLISACSTSVVDVSSDPRFGPLVGTAHRTLPTRYLYRLSPSDRPVPGIEYKMTFLNLHEDSGGRIPNGSRYRVLRFVEVGRGSDARIHMIGEMQSGNQYGETQFDWVMGVYPYNRMLGLP
jgi:hypothetical protein